MNTTFNSELVVNFNEFLCKHYIMYDYGRWNK